MLLKSLMENDLMTWFYKNWLDLNSVRKFNKSYRVQFLRQNEIFPRSTFVLEFVFLSSHSFSQMYAQIYSMFTHPQRRKPNDARRYKLIAELWKSYLILLPTSMAEWKLADFFIYAFFLCVCAFMLWIDMMILKFDGYIFQDPQKRKPNISTLCNDIFFGSWISMIAY